MIEYYIFELGCSSSEKSVKMRSKQQAFRRVRRTRHFPVVESKATTVKPYWYARHDFTGSDLHCLPPYHSLTVSYLEVPNNCNYYGNGNDPKAEKRSIS